MKKPFQILGMILFGAACVYGMVYADLTLRAREAYTEGEKYWYWNDHPEAKKDFFEKEFSKEKGKLDAELQKGTLTHDQYDQKIELIQFERDERVRESSIKYAYIWYQTAVELFSPPESKWVILSRQKMAQAKELWKKELTAKKIPFKDYMLE